jgi:ribonuclease D
VDRSQRHVRWIATSADLAAELADVGPGPLALDTEADSFHHYRERLCLVQMSFGARDLVIDPLAGLDVGILAPLLADGAVRKILHGADFDVRLLDREHGLTVNGVWDTMIAARLAGIEAVGLAALLEQRFGVRLDKSLQRADWSARPLSAAMREYAVADTRWLEPLAHELGAELDRLGRTQWAEESFRRLEALRWEEPPADRGFRRIKGSGTLDRRGLAILRELHAMRECLARDEDVPPFRVLGNSGLLEIARRRPCRSDELRAIDGLGPRWYRASGVERILAAIDRAMRLAPEELPRHPDRPPPPDPEFESRLRRLLRARDTIAREIALDPGTLAPRAALADTLERIDRGDGLSPELMDWQAGFVRRALETAGERLSPGAGVA